LSKDVELLHNLSEMKKKSNDMSFDMFNDAMSSTPIPVFTTANDAAQNAPSEQFLSVPDVPEVSFDANQIQNELIKVDFDKQTVSARALYEFLVPTERFNFWCKRMFSYGLIENVDFTTVKFLTVVNNSGTKEIGDYLLTIDAAKHIAMVQRSEKGKQARNYFINIEKLYLKGVFSKQTVEASTPLLENLKSIVAQLEMEHLQQQQLQNNYDHLVEKTVVLEIQVAQQNLLQKNYDYLVEKTVVLEKQVAQQNLLQDLKQIYVKKKVESALTDCFTEINNIMAVDEMVNRLPRATNPNTVVVLNPLEKSLQKTTLEEDLIRKWYRPAERKMEHALFLTATDITLHLETFSKKVGVRNVGIALKKLGFERLHRGIDGYQTKGYYVIQLHGSISF
jgi:phage anti-repressor protein